MSAAAGYAVKIEPSKGGGYFVTVSGPGITLSDVHLCDTPEECRAWAAEHVAWVCDREPVEHYTLPAPDGRPEPPQPGESHSVKV
jgi:hypothetical protein